MLAAFSYVYLQRLNCVVGEDVEKLKQRLSLLDYLRQQHWTARPPLTAPSSSDSVPCIRKPALRSMSTPARISFTVTVLSGLAQL